MRYFSSIVSINANIAWQDIRLFYGRVAIVFQDVSDALR
jgi:hypothetical protein